MSSPPDTRAPGGPLWSAADILLAGAGFGMLAGGLESAAALIRQRLLHRPLEMGPELGWQLPLTDAALFLVPAVLLVLLGLVWRRARSPRVVLGCCTALLSLALLFHLDGVHPAVGLALAIAVAVLLAKLLPPAPPRLRRWLRILVPLALAGFLVMGAVDRLARPAVERRALAAVPAAPAAQPNILFLTLNAVRAWNVGAHGYARATTPKLDQWGTHGTVFYRALASAAGTTLSQGVLWTGRHPTELSLSDRLRYDGAYPTLAQVLRRAGYATAGFVGDYAALGRGTGLDRGFVHYEDYPFRPIPLLRQTSIGRRLLELAPLQRLLGPVRLARLVPAAELNARALRWLETQSGRPWFAFLSYGDADEVLAVPPSFATRYLGKPDAPVDNYWQQFQQAYGPPVLPVAALARSLDAYDGAISYLDAQVDTLLRVLGDRGVLSNTIVVVTGDHGKLFGEHGVVGHDNNLYLPVLHVPLMLIAPGRVPRAARIPALAPLRNLAATLLDLARLPRGLPGRSLASLWTPPALGGDTVFAAVGATRSREEWSMAPVWRGDVRSVLLDSLQYLRNGDGAEELYDLRRDAWEVRNLAADSSYRADLERHRRALQAIERSRVRPE